MSDTQYEDYEKSAREEMLLGAVAMLMHEVHATARDKGWWDMCKSAVDGQMNTYRRSRGEQIALMHSELSECLEAVRMEIEEPSAEDQTINVRTRLLDNHLPAFSMEVVELADVLIRIFDYAEAYKLPLGKALLAKIRYNRTRPYRHGGKSM